MPTVLSSSLRHKNLNNFKNTVEDESVYFFVSKPTSWTEGDLTPPSVYDTFTLEPEAHDEMLYLKRVSISNCVNVIRLYRWQENRRYQAYSDKVDLSDLLTKRTISTNEYYPFYVVSDDYRVYKCVDNGATPSNPYGVASTVEPTTVAFIGSDTYTPLSDGYIWKYMYTLKPLDASEFLTTDWFPVRTLTEDDGTDNWDIITNAVPGGVYNIKVTNSGSSYTNILPATDDSNTTNTQGFTYSGSGASIAITSGSPSGTNDVYNGCYLYTKNGSGVVQEVVEVTDYVGSTNTLTLSGSVTGSLRAFISPKVVATGNGSGLIAIARMSSNALREIQIFAAGSGYSECSITFSGGSGSGAAAEAIISPFGGHGSDPVVELGAFNLLSKTKFSGDEGGVIVSSNEYRKIGIIIDPLIYGSLKQAQARTSGLTTSQMTLSSTDSAVNDFHNGKKIYIYSGKGRGQLRTVEDYVGSTKLLTVTEPFDVLPDNTSYYGFLATSSVINQCLILNYSTISGTAVIPADTTIYQGSVNTETAKGTVVQHDTVNKKIYITNLSNTVASTAGNFVSGSTYTIVTVGTTDFTLIGAASNNVGVTFTATGVGSGTGTASVNYPYFAATSTTTGSSTFTTSSITDVGVHPNTGTVIYVENRTPLSRYVEQIEDIRVIIQF
jgi:hypothetical protein